MSKKPSLRALELQRPGPVLMCRKCLKRMADGGKLKRRLKAGIKQRNGGQRKGRARLVLTNCFGICPKDAAVTASAATFARGEVLLIRDCSEKSIKQATAALIESRVTGAAQAGRREMAAPPETGVARDSELIVEARNVR
jgi:hypothetical protein